MIEAAEVIRIQPTTEYVSRTHENVKFGEMFLVGPGIFSKKIPGIGLDYWKWRLLLSWLDLFEFFSGPIRDDWMVKTVYALRIALKGRKLEQFTFDCKGIDAYAEAKSFP